MECFSKRLNNKSGTKYKKIVFVMLLLIKVTLSCIDDQSTFIKYENIRLLMLFERDSRDRRLVE